MKLPKEETLLIATGCTFAAIIGAIAVGMGISSERQIHEQRQDRSAVVKAVDADGFEIHPTGKNDIFIYGNTVDLSPLTINDNCTLGSITATIAERSDGQILDLDDYTYTAANKYVGITFQNKQDLLRILGEQPCVALITGAEQ